MQRIWDYYSYPILSYPILLYATTLSSEKSTTWDEQFGIEGNEVGVGVGVRDGEYRNSVQMDRAEQINE